METRNCRVWELSGSLFDVRRRSLTRDAIAPPVSRSGKGEEKKSEAAEEKDEIKSERSIGRERAKTILSVFSTSSLFFLFLCNFHPHLCSPMYPIPPVTKTLGMADVSWGERKAGERRNGEERKKKLSKKKILPFDGLLTLLRGKRRAEALKQKKKKRLHSSDTRCSLACVHFGLLFSTPARCSISPDTARSNKRVLKAQEHGVQRRHRGRRRRRRGHGRTRRHVPADDGEKKSRCFFLLLGAAEAGECCFLGLDEIRKRKSGEETLSSEQKMVETRGSKPNQSRQKKKKKKWSKRGYENKIKA